MFLGKLCTTLCLNKRHSSAAGEHYSEVSFLFILLSQCSFISCGEERERLVQFNYGCVEWNYC